MSTKKNMAMFLLILFCMACIAGCGSNVSDETVVNQTDTADPAGQAAEESIKRNEIPVILTVDGKDISAVIYDTPAGRSVIAGLPYTVHLSKGTTDFCDDIGVSFEYTQRAHRNTEPFGQAHFVR